MEGSREPLKDAYDKNDFETMKKLIEEDPQIISNQNIFEYGGYTVLLQAIIDNRSELVRYILTSPKISQILDVNKRDSYGYNALLITIRDDGNETVGLVFRPSDGLTRSINRRHRYGRTALHYAANNDKVDCLKMLLNHPQIDIHIKEYFYGKTALWLCGSKECFELLLPRYQSTMNEDEVRMARVWCARWRKEVEEVKELMESFPPTILQQPQMKEDVSMLLLVAPYRVGNIEMIEYLLSSYSHILDINIQDKKDGRTPLHYAVIRRYKSLIDLLLSHPNIDLTIKDKDGKTALDMAEYDSSIAAKLKIHPFIPYRNMVQWNRSKIMLVGQGRAGKTALANNLVGKWEEEDKTASTIGAEQMDMRLYYGGVKGGRLEEYKRAKSELSSVLAELSLSQETGKNVEKKSEPAVVSMEVGSLSNRQEESGLREVEDESNRHKEPKLSDPAYSTETTTQGSHGTSGAMISEKDTSIVEAALQKCKTSNVPFQGATIKPSDIRLDDVMMHYRQLRETEISSSYKVSLIDFGGQSIFNVLHAFFMSRYGIYLLVFDMELFLSEDEAKRESCHKELKFWMNSIVMHTYSRGSVTGGGEGRTAPVAIVGTRGDKIRSREEHEKISRELEERYGESELWQLNSLIRYRYADESSSRGGGTTRELCFFPNNNKEVENNAVTGQLLLRIEECLEQADYLKREIPIMWVKMLDEMRELGRSYLSYEEVRGMAESKGTRVEEGGSTDKDRYVDLDHDMSVREMLRFLHDMGVLMWIEERGLDDMIILDPIEYLVKPASTIICQHVAGSDDPYGTRHEVGEIHGASKRAYQGDWMRMLEYGMVSGRLVRDLLNRYYEMEGRKAKEEGREAEEVEGDEADFGDFFFYDLDRDYDEPEEKEGKKVVKEEKRERCREHVIRLMQRYGLMVSLLGSSSDEVGSASANATSDIKDGQMYFIPSLLPEDLTLSNYKERRFEFLREIMNRIQMRQQLLNVPLRNPVRLSLFFYLPNGRQHSYDFQGILDRQNVVAHSVKQLVMHGFKPNGLFERLIGSYFRNSYHRLLKADTLDEIDFIVQNNEVMIGFHDKIEFLYDGCRVRIINRWKENLIDVEVENDLDEDKDTKKEDKDKQRAIIVKIHEELVGILQRVLNESYASLQVMTLVPIPAVDLTGSIEGFIPLVHVRRLLDSSKDSNEEKKTHKPISYDGLVGLTLKAKSMKKDDYWSIWKLRRPVDLLSVSANNSTTTIAALPLQPGMKYHVFLSHDWGIDNKNHERVKQINEALKRRGYITWIDDEKILTDLNTRIVDGIVHSECMLVFVTENYQSKVNKEYSNEYCRMELLEGKLKLTKERMIPVVLQSSMKERKDWKGVFSLQMEDLLYQDLSSTFEAEDVAEEEVHKKMDELCDVIGKVIGVSCVKPCDLPRVKNES